MKKSTFDSAVYHIDAIRDLKTIKESVNSKGTSLDYIISRVRMMQTIDCNMIDDCIRQILHNEIDKQIKKHQDTFDSL